MKKENMLDKKQLRKLAIEIIKEMYSLIEYWTPKVDQIEDDIPVVEAIIRKVLNEKPSQ